MHFGSEASEFTQWIGLSTHDSCWALLCSLADGSGIYIQTQCCETSVGTIKSDTRSQTESFSLGFLTQLPVRNHRVGRLGNRNVVNRGSRLFNLHRSQSRPKGPKPPPLVSEQLQNVSERTQGPNSIPSLTIPCNLVCADGVSRR